MLSETTSLLQKDSFIVTSVPNNLNIFSTKCSNDCDFIAAIETNDIWSSHHNQHRNTKNNHWQDSLTTTKTESIASKNFDLAQTFGGVSYQHTTTSQPNAQQQKIINSSYNNLTILDYSGSTFSVRNSFGNQLRMMAEKQKRHSVSSSNRSSASSTEFSKCNFLLDEISAHFDKSLSILNDKNVNDDETDSPRESILETKEIASVLKIEPPQPPPRKHQTKKPTSQLHSEAEMHETFMDSNEHFTFDRDPTNLQTCYAESLEKCNFDASESSNSINLLEHHQQIQTKPFSPNKHSTPIKYELIASTPNLSQHRFSSVDDSEECLQTSSAYNSLNPLPQSEASAQTKGILSAGSRNSLGKGVSFYPYVSEISWHEQSSIEDTPDLTDTENR